MFNLRYIYIVYSSRINNINNNCAKLKKLYLSSDSKSKDIYESLIKKNIKRLKEIKIKQSKINKLKEDLNNVELKLCCVDNEKKELIYSEFINSLKNISDEISPICDIIEKSVKENELKPPIDKDKKKKSLLEGYIFKEPDEEALAAVGMTKNDVLIKNKSKEKSIEIDEEEIDENILAVIGMSKEDLLQFKPKIEEDSKEMDEDDEDFLAEIGMTKDDLLSKPNTKSKEECKQVNEEEEYDEEALAAIGMTIDDLLPTRNKTKKNAESKSNDESKGENESENKKKRTK